MSGRCTYHGCHEPIAAAVHVSLSEPEVGSRLGFGAGMCRPHADRLQASMHEVLVEATHHGLGAVAA